MTTVLLVLALIALAFGFSLDVARARYYLIKGVFTKKGS